MASHSQDDFSQYENPVKRIHEDDQLRFYSILMLNTALQTPLIADHAETSSWIRSLYVNKCMYLLACMCVIFIYSWCLKSTTSKQVNTTKYIYF